MLIRLVNLQTILWRTLLGASIVHLGYLHAQEGYRISDVSMAGNDTLSTELLTSQLTIPPTSWLDVTILGDDPSLFLREEISRETESLKRFCQTEGFLGATVRDSILYQDDDDKIVEMMYLVEEGKSTGVGNVEFSIDREQTGDKVLDSLSGVFRDLLSRMRGRRFRDAEMVAIRNTLLAALNETGFPHTTVSWEISLRQINDSADVHWNIKPGPYSYFGETSIEGNELYNIELISDRIRYTKGEVYKQSLLEETQLDLYDLRLYRTVSLNAELRQGETEIPIRIQVRETPRYAAQLGVGYGRDERFRFSGKFDILGILGTAGQVGLEIKTSALEPFNVQVSYLHPDFIIPKMRFSVKPFLRREDEPGYDARRQGYDIAISRSIIGDLFGVITYSTESVELNRYPAVEVPPDFVTDYPKESVTLILGFDDSRPLFTPLNGFSIAFSATYSGIDFLKNSEYHFIRSLLDFRWYTNFDERTVIAAKLKVGSIRSLDDPPFVPFEDRYYAGGSTSVRGWSRSDLGPKDPNGAPTGGNSLLESSVELRFPHEETLSGVLFFDAGNVWSSSATYKLNDLEYAAGLGVRYATPIGPFRLDVARPVFSASRELQWWFSIGHAF